MLNNIDPAQILTTRDNFAAYAHVNSELVQAGAESRFPKVSIMIPTFRRPHLLHEAIESALNQHANEPYEIVIVDNELDAEIAKQVNAVAQKFTQKNVWLYRNSQNIGMFGNWNRCLELAKASWVTILNDDDMLLPIFIETVCSAIKKWPTATVIKTTHICNNEKKTWINNFKKKLLNEENQLHLKDFVLGNTALGSLGIVYSKIEAIKLGGFNEDYYPVSDYIFNLMNMYQYDCFYSVNKKCSIYRINHGANASIQPGIMERNILWQNIIFNAYNYVYSNNKNAFNIYKKLYAASSVRSFAATWKIEPDYNKLECEYGIKIPKSHFIQFIISLIKKFIYLYLRR
jgi:glycosyltransferase involved in cell wall biosynthesis